MRALKAISLLFVILVLAGGCRSMTGESAGQNIDDSTITTEVKAKLSGDVRVNFKSDYLPLEKMATPEMMSVIQGNSTPYNPNKPAATS